MVRHRMGARGNATTFPLPWTELLLHMQSSDAASKESEAPDLPVVGEELWSCVSIFLKTNEEQDPKHMASFVHQAHARRDVIVGLIEGAQSRGHRSYRHVNMDDWRKRVVRLPENGVPPDILRLRPHDAGLNKIMIQKAAAPVGGRGSLEEAGSRLDQAQPNAVVLQKSGVDDSDISSQRIAALSSFTERLTGESEGIATEDPRADEAAPRSDLGPPTQRRHAERDEAWVPVLQRARRPLRAMTRIELKASRSSRATA